ncbi:hypothetical protein FOB58_005668 [Candida parapsilosis]|uniref:Uncharacterized protein n=2 Tax=Candida parapsilosis TaxID=5480 RepID=G8BKH5_CANPC|nr:uncharacterized protein CPAR2_702530 [Candida parapsilosis]KAF6042185.1 hypothetical protein FOB58_005668 [Candida parapsilosis]KAF6042464.1 hypothetical protein FOB59_005646 [Candida parapsilosis]KAF6042909.1 hypothetical protein FOB60_005663 [Candida parapsilosis]KAF6058082.1 hypothetical protein FOB61_005671 [Candida parapsilosis]KAI5903178.1 hypothetical protein K4G60_g2333 [Candida parapsilosis]
MRDLLRTWTTIFTVVFFQAFVRAEQYLTYTWLDDDKNMLMIGIPEYVQKRDTGNVPFDANLSMTISNEIIINLNGVENLYYAVNPTIKKEDVSESDLTDFFKNEVAVSLGISHLVTNDTEAVLKKQWFGV